MRTFAKQGCLLTWEVRVDLHADGLLLGVQFWLTTTCVCCMPGKQSHRMKGHSDTPPAILRGLWEMQ